MDIDDWKAMSLKEQFEDWQKWNPYEPGDRENLINKIAEEFQSQHPELTTQGWGNVHGELQLLVAPKTENYPQSFLGVPVRRLPG